MGANLIGWQRDKKRSWQTNTQINLLNFAMQPSCQSRVAICATTRNTNIRVCI